MATDILLNHRLQNRHQYFLLLYNPTHSCCCKNSGVYYNKNDREIFYDT